MASMSTDQDQTQRPHPSEEIYRSLVEKSFDAIVVLQEGKVQFINSQATDLLNLTGDKVKRMELATRPNAYLSLVPPELRVDVLQGIEAALRGTNGPDQVEYRLTGSDGKIVNVEARSKPIEYDGRPALLLVIRDITQRKRAKIVERIRKELCCSANPESLLKPLVDRCRRLLHSDLVSLDLLDEESGRLFVHAAAGEASEQVERVEKRRGVGLTGWVVETGSPINVVDYPCSNAFPRDLGLDSFMARIGVRSAMAVPLMVASRVIGALAVFNRREISFSKEDEDILERLAHCAAAAIESSRLHSKAQQMSVGGATLLEIGSAIGSTLQLKQLLKIVAQKTAAASRTDRCSIISWTKDGWLVPLMSQFATSPPDRPLWAAFKDLKRYRTEEISAFTHVIEHREPVVIDNPAASPLVPQDWIKVFQLKSILVVPLVRHDRVVGALVLDNMYEWRPFDEEQIQLASTIANQVALAIENARLFQETQRRLQESETLLAVSRSVSSTLDLTEVIRRVAREATRALGADSAAAYRYESSADLLQPLAAYHLPTERRLAMREVPVSVRGFPFLEEAWRTKQKVFSNDTARDPRCDSRLLRQFPQKSTLFVPMVVKEEIMGGFFLFWWEREHQFSPQQLLLADGIAQQAAMAIENARLYSDLERSNADLQESKRIIKELYRLSVALQESLTPTARLDLILRGVHEIAGLDKIALFLTDSEDRSLRAVAGVGAIDEPLEGVQIPLDSRGGALARAFLESREIRVDGSEPLPPELRLSPPYSDIRWLRSRSFLILPLISRNKAIGVIGMCNRLTRRPLPQDIELLQIFANHAATAIENARLYEKEKTAKEESVKRAAELAALIKGNTLITSSLNLDQVLDGIVTIAKELTGLPHWIVMLANEQQELIWKTMIQIPEEVQKIGRLKIWESLSGLVAKTGEPVIVEDMGSDPRFHFPHLAIKYGFKSYLGVPMKAKGKLVGVLATLTSEPHHFIEEEINLLTAFADQAAIAIENAQLYSKVKELAIHKERNRLARTLHDRLAQALFSVGLNLEWCLHRLSGHPQVIQRIGNAKQQVGSLMAQVRKLIYEFSGEEHNLRKGDPPTILRTLVEDFERLSGIRGHLHLKGTSEGLDSELMIIVYRSIQEGLVNIVKHSKATTALIAVEILDGLLRFQVADDGEGRAAEVEKWAQAGTSCFGLRQMRVHLAEGGGSLRIEDNTPTGLRLSGTLPIPVASQGEAEKP